MRVFLAVVVAILALSYAPTLATAGSLDDLKIGLHRGAYDEEAPCTGAGAPVSPGCGGTSTLNVTAPSIGTFWVYVVAMDISPGAGLSALEFAIDFDDTPGVGASFTGAKVNCGDLEFVDPGWPQQANTKATIIWLAGNCQDTPDPNDPQGQASVVVYALECQSYSEDLVCIVPRIDGVYGATDCSSVTTNLHPEYPQNAGCLGLGVEGYLPCTPPIPVEEATWGDIKRVFSPGN